MTIQEFVKTYYAFAKTSEEKTGVPALVILAQAGLESAWGKSAPGNMFFGVKDKDGINGNEQLLRTSEYLATDKAKFPEILSIKWDVTKKLYHYVVRDYFRKYNSPEESFTDHAKMLSTLGRYKPAMTVRHDPYLFATAIKACGYATDPDYAQKLHKLIDQIKIHIP